MNEVVADTHAILWLMFAPHHLSPLARSALIDAVQSKIHLSAISLVEIAYLIDKRRFPEMTLDLFVRMVVEASSGIVLAPVSTGVARALRLIIRRLVPDMPDRIIAATAVHRGLPLVTADSKIHSSGIAVIW